MRNAKPFLFGAAAIVIAAAGAVSYVALRERAVADRPPAVASARVIGPDGAFELTAQQLRGLTIEPIRVARLEPTRSAEGKIAINENKSTPVFSQFGSARVVRLFADTGDVVAKGAPLLAVESPDMVQAGNDLVAAVAGVDKARSLLQLAQNVETRQHALFDARAGALKDWQQAEADLTGARNDLRGAEIALAAVRNRLTILGKSGREIASLEGSRAIDPATVIPAPIAGVVVERKVGPGQFITASVTDPIYVLGDLSTVWLLAAVKETDVPYVKLGQAVSVRVLAFPDRTFAARIVSIGAAIDPTIRRLPVRAEVDNPDGLLKPEMFAEFRIATGPAIETPAVPDGSVVYEGDVARVWVETADGRFASRVIEPGIKDRGMVQVVSGLQPTDRLVTRGTLFIDRAARPGP